MTSHQKKIGFIIGAVIAAIAIAAVTILLIPTTKIHFSAIQVERMDLTEAVTATGQVAGDENVALAFDTPGTVSFVNVQAGDTVYKGQILGALSSDILSANLESAQANVIAAQAQLTQLQRGNRPEAVAVYSQKVSDAGSNFATAIHDSYLKVQDALNNKTDALFTNPQSTNPVINVFTTNDTVKNNINNERLILGEKLTAWSAISGNDYSTSTQTLANNTLNYAKKFFTDLAAITSNLSMGNSGLSQAQISADATTVNSAASEANAGMGEYIGALAAYSEANNGLTLEAASGTNEDVQTQSAKVAAAQAQADLVQSQINHTVIRAPFDGVITFVNAKVGAVSVTGSPAFGIITKGLKIEVQVPENAISKITGSSTAIVTLDSYGASTTFAALVSQIDPAETVVNGINSYKVTLQFTNDDPRIRSGMTANVSIVTGKTQQALAVPSQAIITKGKQTYVLVQDANSNSTQQEVQTGITGINGYTEILSGLTEGQTVASFGNGATNQ
ncbi:MAG: efflux RND transporter periplasmic adaptor subunit [bacterium]